MPFLGTGGNTKVIGQTIVQIFSSSIMGTTGKTTAFYIKCFVIQSFELIIRPKRSKQSRYSTKILVLNLDLGLKNTHKSKHFSVH